MREAAQLQEQAKSPAFGTADNRRPDDGAYDRIGRIRYCASEGARELRQAMSARLCRKACRQKVAGSLKTRKPWRRLLGTPHLIPTGRGPDRPGGIPS